MHSRKLIIGVAVLTTFLVVAATAYAQFISGVPSANSRSGSPADVVASNFNKHLVAAGSQALENPSGIVDSYGYLNDAASQASGLKTKTEPDQNTYLATNSNPGGPNHYNYGHHFLIQGHEVFSSATPGVGHSNSAYFTRVNLDVPYNNPHRITLLSSADANGNTGAASVDGSTYSPWSGDMVFTGEGNNQYGGVFVTKLRWHDNQKPATTQLLGSLGTAGYEGVQFDKRGIAYLLEDAGGGSVTDGATATKVKQPNSFFFRFVPWRTGDLRSGGRLQVLQINDASNNPITFHSTGTGPRDDALGQPIADLHSGAPRAAKWITVHDTRVDGTATFNANTLAKSKGGTPLKRPENGRFVPGTDFKSFVITETGDTNKDAGNYPGAAARGAWGAVLRFDVSSPGASSGTVKAIALGDATHNSFDSVSFFSQDLMWLGEDRGDSLHAQLNALDSTWSFDITKSLGAISGDAQRVIALGRDTESTDDVNKKEHAPPIADQNDGDNEITGVHTSAGLITRAGLLGSYDPFVAQSQFGNTFLPRTFVTYQHGANSTYELVPSN